MNTLFQGDTVTITDQNGDTIRIQLTPRTDTETGAIVWRENMVIGGLWRKDQSEKP